MTDFQHKFRGAQSKAFRCQAQHFGYAGIVHLAHTLQPDLRLFPESVRCRGHAVNVLMVIQFLQCSGSIFPVFYDRKSHVRFQRHQPPGGIRKGNDSIRKQEIFVPAVQVVFLKLAHTVTLISVPGIQ